jgi:hypothetical protein
MLLKGSKEALVNSGLQAVPVAMGTRIIARGPERHGRRVCGRVF